MKGLFLFFFMLWSLVFWGQKRDQFDPFIENNYFGFHFDDDFLLFANRDEQYTGGVEFEYIRKSKKIKSSTSVFNPFSNGQRYWTAVFGGSIYTPNNVSDSLIILNDRPFSSYIYTTIGYTAYDKHKRKKLTAEIYLGIMGSRLPGKIQDKIHTVGESPPTYGWKYRIAPNEIFIPNIRINYQENLYLIGPIKALPFDWFQIGANSEINAGLFANNILFGAKIAVFNSKPIHKSAYYYNPNWNNNRLSSEKAKKINFSAYFKPQIQLVAYNTSLQGLPWMNSPYTLGSELINRHVWVMEMGLNINVKRFHFSYVIQVLSQEFTKYKRDWHSWAGITLGYTF